jgi:hypothetical protein
VIPLVIASSQLSEHTKHAKLCRPDGIEKVQTNDLIDQRPGYEFTVAQIRALVRPPQELRTAILQARKCTDLCPVAVRQQHQRYTNMHKA